MTFIRSNNIFMRAFVCFANSVTFHILLSFVYVSDMSSSFKMCLLYMLQVIIYHIFYICYIYIYISSGAIILSSNNQSIWYFCSDCNWYKPSHDLKVASRFWKYEHNYHLACVVLAFRITFVKVSSILTHIYMMYFCKRVCLPLYSAVILRSGNFNGPPPPLSSPTTNDQNEASIRYI